MRTFFLPVILFLSISSSAQYYYKDIIGTRESAELIKTYRSNKVARVMLSSYDKDNARIEDFYVEQQFTPSLQMLRTITRSDVTNESILTSYSDANGNIIKTVDSSDVLVSITTYSYNSEG